MNAIPLRLFTLTDEERAELEWQAANPGLPSMDERAASMARVKALLDAHPRKAEPTPDPTPEQIDAARREADDAVRGLFADLGIEPPLVMTERAFNGEGV